MASLLVGRAASPRAVTHWHDIVFQTDVPHPTGWACTVCGDAAAVMCSRCACAPFCSRACQADAWTLHKPGCTSLSRALSQEESLVAAQRASDAPEAHVPVRGASPAAVAATLRRCLQVTRQSDGSAPKLNRGVATETCYLFTAVQTSDPVAAAFWIATLPPGSVDAPWQCSAPAACTGGDGNLERLLTTVVGDMSALTWLCFSGKPSKACTALAAVLIDCGADLHYLARRAPHSPQGITPLIAAAAAGNVAVVRLLLERGADPNQRGCGMFALNALDACGEGAALDIARALLDAGADIEGRVASTSESALFQAVLLGRARLAQLLVSRGASTACMSIACGLRAVDVATTRPGRGGCLAVLLAAGVDATPLPLLVHMGPVKHGEQLESMQLLGAAAVRQRVQGGVQSLVCWPSLCAESLGTLGAPAATAEEVLLAMLEARALDPNWAELRLQRRPLLSIIAARGEGTEAPAALRALLAAGADACRADANGRGPLWHALRSGSESVALALLKAGARPLPPPPPDARKRPSWEELHAGSGADSGGRCREVCLAARRQHGTLLRLLEMGLAAPPGSRCACGQTMTQMLYMTVLITSSESFQASLARGRLPKCVSSTALIMRTLRRIARDFPDHLGAEAMLRLEPHAMKGPEMAQMATSTPAYMIGCAINMRGELGPSDEHIEALRLLAAAAFSHASLPPLSTAFAERSVGSIEGRPTENVVTMLMSKEFTDASGTPEDRRSSRQAQLVARTLLVLGHLFAGGNGSVALGVGLSGLG